MKTSIRASIRIKGGKEFWKTGIEALDLSARPYGALKNVKVDTLDDLTRVWATMDRLRNLGSTSQKEIRSKFINYYLENSDETKVQDFIDDIYEAKKVPATKALSVA